MEDYSKHICDFSLILIIYLFFIFPRETATFSHSIFGRTFAVLMIIFYTNHDVLYGLFFCILVIFYYQLDTEYYLYSLNRPTLEQYREGFTYEYQIENGKTDDFDKTVQNTSTYQQETWDGEPSSLSEPLYPGAKILDRRLAAEYEIMMPKNSNEWLDTILSRMSA